MKDSATLQIFPSATVCHSFFRVLSFYQSRQHLGRLALFGSLGVFVMGCDCAELREQAQSLTNPSKAGNMLLDTDLGQTEVGASLHLTATL